MDQAGHGAIAVFAQRIVGLAQAAVELGGGGNHRSPQGLVAVVARDQAHVVGRDADRQHGAPGKGPPARRPRAPTPAPIGPGFAADFGPASANRSSRDREPRDRKPCGKPWFGRCSGGSGPTRDRGRRYRVGRWQVAVSAGRISLQHEETGIGPSYSEAPHHLHTSTNTPQHQCWPSRNILLGSSGESGARHPNRPLKNDAPANELRYRPGAVLLFLIPFGNTIRKLEVIHTVRRENVKRKTCRWTGKADSRLAVASARHIRPSSRISRRRRGTGGHERRRMQRRITPLTNSTQMPPARSTLCIGVYQSSRRQRSPTSSQIWANSRRL